MNRHLRTEGFHQNGGLVCWFSPTAGQHVGFDWDSLFFSILVSYIRLYFGFVLKTVLLTQGCFHYC